MILCTSPENSRFAFYLWEVWNHIGSEVTKKDDRVSSVADPGLLAGELGPSSYARGWEGGEGGEDDSRSRLSRAGMRGILVECRPPWQPLSTLSPALNPSSARGRAFVGWRTFRRTEIMKSETQGTYSRSPFLSPPCPPPPPPPPQYAGSPSSCRRRSPGCPRARRLAKVRMMYRAATIMASLALSLSEKPLLDCLLSFLTLINTTPRNYPGTTLNIVAEHFLETTWRFATWKLNRAVFIFFFS